MVTVFQPIHDEMMAVITKNADLLIEDDLPQPLQLFCAHVAAYKVIFERWRKGDFAELARYLDSSFRRLKSEQAELLGGQAKAFQAPRS